MNSVIQASTKPLSDVVTQLLLRYQRAIVFTTLASVIFSWLVGNYRAFRTLSGSGLGQGLLGWLIALSLKPFGRETTSTREYERDPNKDSWLRDPASIPERRGTRPLTGWHFLPHRQINRIPTAKIAERLDDIFRKLANDNAGRVSVVKSPHEKIIDAMVINNFVPSPHKQADHALREITHVHHVDHSIHAVLAPQDCKLVIERGWAERHPLSGVSKAIPLPKEYLLVYAPTDDEELDIVERIMSASIAYMTNRRKVN